MRKARQKRPALPVQKWAYLMMGSLTALMLMALLLFQGYLVNYAEEVHLASIDVVMGGIASEVRDTFAQMTTVVDYLSQHTNVQDYARTTDTEARYQKAFNQARPIVEVAAQTANPDSILVLDVTGAWFRFWGTRSVSAHMGEQIIEHMGTTKTLTNTVMAMDGKAYFCTIKPIFVLERGDARAVGLVAALNNVDRIRRIFDEYVDRQEIVVLLHNFDEVLLSNHPELEGLSLQELPSSQESQLQKEEVILPGNLGVIISIPRAKVFPQRTSVMLILISMGAFLLLLMFVMASFTNKYIVRPFSHVINETNDLGRRDLSRRLSGTGVPHVDELVLVINAMLERLEEYNARVASTQRNLYQMELSQRETQMYLLRNQIDRHFLYNSLTSIRALADHGENEKVKEVASGIAQLLRYTTARIKEVNIFDEMEIVNRYVNIQNIRFDGMFALEIDVDDRLCEYKILRLLLQPLAENALIHGLEKKRGACVMTLRGYMTEWGVRIEVEDNGVGISAQRLERIQANIRDADKTGSYHGIEGIAMVNIQKRIHIAYGNRYGLTLRSEEGRYTLATLDLPAILDVEAETEL